MKGNSSVKSEIFLANLALLFFFFSVLSIHTEAVLSTHFTWHALWCFTCHLHMLSKDWFSFSSLETKWLKFGVYLTYNVVLVSSVQQGQSFISKYSWASLLSSPHISLLDLLSYPTTHSTRTLYSSSYLLHSSVFTYVSAICSSHPILSFPLCVHKSVFYDCISSYPPNGFFSTCFLDSNWMH